MSVMPTGPCPAKIMIVGEFPGDEEIQQGIPFVGYSGQELNRMLQEAGIMRTACFMSYVIRVKPPGNSVEGFIATKKKDITNNHVMVRGKFVLPCVRDGIKLLEREIEMCRPNVIIALGNVALWALTEEWGIGSWRGSVMQTDLWLSLDYQPKVVPTYGPSAILRNWDWRQISINDLRRAERQSKFREQIRANYDFIIRPSFDTVLSVLHQLYKQLQLGPVRLGTDIETRAGHIACLGIAWSNLNALCIPFMCVEREEGYWLPEQEAAIVFALYQVLAHPNCQNIGQNFIYDAQYIYRWWHFIPTVCRDTMLTQHVLFSNMPKGLAFLSSMYLEDHLYWKDEGKTWDKNTGEEQLWTYNCKDAVVTFAVDTAQQEAVNKMGLREVHDFQQKLFYPVLETMNRGLHFDTKNRAQFAMDLHEEIAKREQWMMDTLGIDLNIRSPLQMKEFFYDTLRQKPIISRKTGTITCDDEALRTISEREPILKPVVTKIQELRSLGVFLSTFVLANLDTDGKMRCSFNIGGTETYRFSSSKDAFGSGLNLQNIPKGGEEADGLELPNVRNLFIPAPGYTFFDIDLSSADLRIVVWESNELEMKAMLREGLDPYTEIAKEFYHDPSITKKDPRRQTFKSFAHGTNYLGTAKGLAERLGLSVHEADKTQKWYFGRFPAIKKWQNDLKDSVLKRRMVQNVFGYRCYFFDRIEGTIFNQAAAWIPQSTVACLINRGYVNIYEQLKEVEVLLQVHDSLAGQFPTHLGDWAVQQIIEKCSITLPYDDPLVIPVGIKTSTKSWGDCE